MTNEAAGRRPMTLRLLAGHTIDLRGLLENRAHTISDLSHTVVHN